MDRDFARIFGGEQVDHSLDLAPAAEMHDIAEPAAVVRPGRRLGRRRGVGKVHILLHVFPLVLFVMRPFYPRVIAKAVTGIVNGA